MPNNLKSLPLLQAKELSEWDHNIWPLIAKLFEGKVKDRRFLVVLFLDYRTRCVGSRAFFRSGDRFCYLFCLYMIVQYPGGKYGTLMNRTRTSDQHHPAQKRPPHLIFQDHPTVQKKDARAPNFAGLRTHLRSTRLLNFPPPYIPKPTAKEQKIKNRQLDIPDHEALPENITADRESLTSSAIPMPWLSEFSG